MTKTTPSGRISDPVALRLLVIRVAAVSLATRAGATLGTRGTAAALDALSRWRTTRAVARSNAVLVPQNSEPPETQPERPINPISAAMRWQLHRAVEQTRGFHRTRYDEPA